MIAYVSDDIIIAEHDLKCDASEFFWKWFMSRDKKCGLDAAVCAFYFRKGDGYMNKIQSGDGYFEYKFMYDGEECYLNMLPEMWAICNRYNLFPDWFKVPERVEQISQLLRFRI